VTQSLRGTHCVCPAFVVRVCCEFAHQEEVLLTTSLCVFTHTVSSSWYLFFLYYLGCIGPGHHPLCSTSPLCAPCMHSHAHTMSIGITITHPQSTLNTKLQRIHSYLPYIAFATHSVIKFVLPYHPHTSPLMGAMGTKRVVRTPQQPLCRGLSYLGAILPSL
jgi:hypothetical protein